MSKIIFNGQNTNVRYVQGSMPAEPGFSKLRRTEVRRERSCEEQSYHGQREERHSSLGRNRKQIRSFIDEEVRPAEKRVSDNFIPIWLICTAISALGLGSLFIPMMTLKLDLGFGLSSSLSSFNLIEMILSMNKMHIAEYTGISPFVPVASVGLIAADLVYFMITRENAFNRSYIPLALAFGSFALAFVFFFVFTFHSIASPVTPTLGNGILFLLTVSFILLTVTFAGVFIKKTKKLISRF